MADNTEPKPTSFIASLTSGIAGFVKGVIAGGLFGLVAGAAVGAIAAYFAPVAVAGMATSILGPVAAQASALGGDLLLGAAGGAALVGAAFASVGSLAGSVTGVVKSQQSSLVSADDAINAVKVSMAQGIQLGAQMNQAQEAQNAVTKNWGNKVRQEQQTVAQNDLVRH